MSLKPHHNDSLISVVVPAHNLSDCIGMCIESLLTQTYENFEVICVDDASDDGTYEVLRRYALKDDRLRILRLNKNCGPSFARNVGVEHAVGELVSFVDGDDLVSPHYLQTLLDAWNAAGHDNVFVKALNIRGPRETVSTTQWHRHSATKTRTLTSQEAIRELLLERISDVIWATLVSRELLLQHPLPIGMAFEDHYALPEYLQSVDYVVIVDTPIYAYVRRPESLSNPTLYTKQHADDMVTTVGHLLELSQGWKGDIQGPLAWACAWRLALVVRYCDNVVDKAEVRDDYQLATRYIRAHLPAILRTWHEERLDDNQMRKILITAASPHLYWLLRKLFIS